MVTLNGSGSSDPDGDALTYAWSRVSGASVTLSGADAARATFTAPAAPGALGFRLTVTDPGGLSDSDSVTVTVRDLAPSFGAARVRWTDMPLADGGFIAGSAGMDYLQGNFHGPGHEEAWGVFDTTDYIGAFGAKRTP